MDRIPWLDEAAVARLLPMSEAIATLERALGSGLDPAADPARTVVEVATGHLLLMPSQTPDRVGLKIASVAPRNPERGLPRIQGIYVLCDAETLTPVALLDGTAITSLRTPALSAVAARHLAVPDASRLVVFGTGPQASGHVEALRAVRPISEVTVIGRDPERTEAFARRIAAPGLVATGAAAGEVDAVREADVVVCATTADVPLFPAGVVPDAACVIAVGSHEPDRRELDAALLARAVVVVEDRDTALREAGDIVLARGERHIDPSALSTLTEVVTGRATPEAGRPRVFKSVGMAWQDLAIAADIHARHEGQAPPP